jgi:hypothetical protein
VEEYDALRFRLRERDQRIDHLLRSNAEIRSQIDELEWADHVLSNSPAWRLAKRLDDAARRIAPPDSTRRRLLQLGYLRTRALLRLRP